MARRTASRAWLLLICALSVMVSLPGRPVQAAPPAPLGSTALYHWLTRTAAQALQAAEQDNDLRDGGLVALNRGAASGLDQIEDLVPPWVAHLDVRLSFDEELVGRYGLSAEHAVLEDDHGLIIEALGWIDYDEAGRASGEVGVGLENPVLDHRARLVVRGALDQEWLRGLERYAVRGSLDWGPLRLQGQIFNETAMDEPSGALYEERLLDGYDLDMEATVPTLSWLSFGTRQVWRAANAEDAPDILNDRYSLRVRGPGRFELEAGSTGSTNSERTWFTQVRYQISLGPP